MRDGGGAWTSTFLGAKARHSKITIMLNDRFLGNVEGNRDGFDELSGCHAATCLSKITIRALYR